MVISATGKVTVSIEGPLIEGDIREFFGGLESPDTVDAAFGVKNQITLIVGDQSITRSITVVSIDDDKALFKFSNVSFIKDTSVRWPGVFEDIDAAYIKNRSVIFIRRNYFVSAPIIGGQVSPPKLMQRELFNCPDDEYNKPLLGIYSFPDFVEYQEQLNNTKVTMSTVTEEGQPSRTTQLPSTSSSKATIAIIILIVILLVTVIIIGVVYWRKTGKVSKNASLLNQDTSIVTIDSNF